MATNFRLLMLALPVVLALSACEEAQKEEPTTLIAANPLDITYPISGRNNPVSRSSADPVIALFEDNYYLFATGNHGYWSSPDLLHWNFIESNMLDFRHVAPAIMVYKGELYWMGSADNNLYKTATPEDGSSWKLISDSLYPVPGDPDSRAGDPYLFPDDDGRVYLYWESSNQRPIRGVELDPENGFQPKGQAVVIVPHNEEIYGWECMGDKNEQSGKGWNEGVAMLKHNGRYYLQYAAPGTEFDTYGDGLYIADKPLGPFTHFPASPFSVKLGGWMTGAGHGNTFQDRYGNWWHIATTVISQRYNFERRLGLWPVVFTSDGGMTALTDYGDMPYIIPDHKVDWLVESPWTGWMDLSIGKTVTVSSEMPEHPASHASDFRIKTWWSANSGEKGEWLCLDLGGDRTIYAIQPNFADEAFGRNAADVCYSFKIEASLDGSSWKTIVDRSAVGTKRTHELIVLDSPVKASKVRITNEAAIDGNFSIYDLRVFGLGSGNKPSEVTEIRPVREKDRRRIEISWAPSKDASGYVLHWGVTPDQLNGSCQCLENKVELGLFSLDQDNYYFRVDAFNDSGVTPGKKVVAAK